MSAEDIQTQVEYYFSDANLKKDHFFQTQIGKHPEGFIAMELLLKCNKLKMLTQDAAVVAEALKSSSLVEVNADGTMVRKVGEVPPLDPEVAARQSKRNKTEPAVDAEELKALIDAKAAAATEERLVYKLSGLPAGCRWTDIKDSLKEVMATQGRMHVSHEDNQTEAYITAFKAGNEEAWAEAATSGDKLKVQDAVITMTIVDQPAEALQFWTSEFTKNPPTADKKSQEKAKRETKKDGGRKRKAVGNSTVTLCGVEYDYAALKTRVSEISKAHTEGELVELEGDEKDFMVAVLELHPRAADKKTNMTGMAVGVNEKFPDTRCFFVLKEGGAKEDFSAKKGIDTAFGLEENKKAKAE
eukprot:TRINITY_DN12756_c0_g1_i3.p1 TRINITY_DN12756_c0_g1~~TRINITY_DN12756_c0_g1_i3.p1  ORF type:complete len:357 (+),score=146.78 TRINITY_DN12756_c0_g1_i3:99-1169(+)